MKTEIQLHSYMRHKNICKLYGFWHDAKNIYMVLEFCEGESLFQMLKKMPNKRFGEKVAAKYIMQIAEALMYIHSKKVIYRDLKQENILL